MDADCLIKLTKAQLKERVCTAFDVTIPADVRREVMRNATEHPECTVIASNLASGFLTEVAAPQEAARGEDAALAVYAAGGYEGIASDDKRFVRKLRVLGIPYITPGAFLLLLVNRGHVQVKEAIRKLERLAPMVSADEAAVVKLKLDGLRQGL